MKVPEDSVAGMRRAVAEVCREVFDRGLALSGSGNVSVRCGDLVALSPSGFRLCDVRPRHVTVVTVDGDRVVGAFEPTSESPMHLAVYGKVGEGAIVHAHSPYATALAHTDEPFPTTAELERWVGRVEEVGFLEPGSEELAREVARVARVPCAVILRGHGTLGVGRDLREALKIVEALEEAARVAALRPRP
ncbi:MAG: class II aldolase/adducin family protein [Methanopyri archaeon]|nr:class II aldolase/adducin family protein [Methanopyri archaeon]